MDENEANAANITELEARIGRLNGKLRELMPGTSPHARAEEDLEDYYDRLVQIKNMRVETLSELLRESQEREQQTHEAHVQQTALVLGLLVLVLCLSVSLIELHCPGCITIPVNALVAHVTDSTPAIVLLTGVSVHFATRLWGTGNKAPE